MNPHDMLTNAVAAITPSTRLRALVPATSTIAYAMRRWSCERSSASPSRQPPRIRNIVELP